MTATVRTYTLGCKVNQYETQLVRESLLKHGYRDALPHEPAELCVVNTCTVTAEGDSKSRQAVRRLARDNPQARIIVMGCYATRAPGELATLPGVAEVVADRRELPDVLGRFGVVDMPRGISQFGTRHRAYVKVQDGCMLRCSYCIIPQVRPAVSSRAIDEVLEEVRRLVDGGYREVVLTGVHLGHYGVDWNRGRPRDQWTRLPDLVQAIARVDGDFRVRLSSIEATELTRRLLEVIGEYPDKVCPHLHVCMQSGSDAVLRRMRRRWGAERFRDRCLLAQEVLDRPALTTDVMVGFPGETDAEFEATCALARQIGFSKMHVFPFSARRGTPAATMSGQLPRRVKSQRSRHLAEIEAELRQQYFASLLGARLRVLLESPLDDAPGQLVGTSCRYAPTQLAGPPARCGQFAEVTATSLTSDRMLATAV